MRVQVKTSLSPARMTRPLPRTMRPSPAAEIIHHHIRRDLRLGRFMIMIAKTDLALTVAKKKFKLNLFFFVQPLQMCYLEQLRRMIACISVRDLVLYIKSRSCFTGFFAMCRGQEPPRINISFVGVQIPNSLVRCRWILIYLGGRRRP